MAATISSSSTYLSISSCLPLHHQTTNFHVFPSTTPHLGHALLSPWNGLKHIGHQVKQKFITIERREKGKSKVVHASLFGVGAPEALVIGVVALLVFGPKGLAEVARNLGQTLRAFQPTIRELQDVSREFKSTLEREIGLDDIPSSMPSTTRRTPPHAVSDNENTQSALDPNADQLTNKPYSTEEYLKTTEEQLKAMAAQQQVTTQEPENQSEVQDGAPPAEKPFSLREVLVEAQERSTLAQQQEQTPPQEPQTELETEPEPQPKEATPTATPPTTSESEK